MKLNKAETLFDYAEYLCEEEGFVILDDGLSNMATRYGPLYDAQLARDSTEAGYTLVVHLNGSQATYDTYRYTITLIHTISSP
jgi:hypothetical protein